MTTPDKKPEQVFHSDYDDAAADLVIECQDGVKFRVHSYLLMAHSEYFRNMPPHSDEAVASSVKLIHLDCPSSDFASLLGLVNRSGTRKSYMWSELSTIIKLGATYQFVHIPDLVHQPASRCVNPSNAPEIFQFASAHGLSDLAKVALADFATSRLHNYEYNHFDLAFFDEMTPRYAAALVIAMAPYSHTTLAGSVARWQKISAAFVA